MAAMRCVCLRRSPLAPDHPRSTRDGNVTTRHRRRRTRTEDLDHSVRSSKTSRRQRRRFSVRRLEAGDEARISRRTKLAIGQLCPVLTDQAVSRNSILQKVLRSAILVMA